MRGRTGVEAAFDEGQELGAGNAPHVAPEEATHPLPRRDHHQVGSFTNKKN
jgi:hypothetical protein